MLGMHNYGPCTFCQATNVRLHCLIRILNLKQDESTLSEKNGSSSTCSHSLQPSTKSVEGVFVSKDSSSQGKPPDFSMDIALKEKYASIARIMSEELVRACVSAGAVDNISVVVLLLKGFFNEK